MQEYKTSKYNYFFPYHDNQYVYNTYSGAMLQITENIKQYLIGYPNVPDTISSDEKEAMLRSGILVSKDIDETAVLDYIRTNAVCQDEKVVYEILPTTGCNARCFYCFEEGIVHKTMSLDTAEKVCEFIKKNTPRKKNILIQWFGGEPLLNPNVISYITDELDKFAIENDITVKYQMTTNGSLISGKILELILYKWHISKIQITLDGTKELYEKRKAYVNFPNAFEGIINTINDLANNGILVSIRLNYDRENLDNILELVDYLGKVIVNKENALCYAYPIFDENEENSPDQRENALSLVKINKKVMENGLSRGKNIFQLHFITTKCFACLRNSFLITPEGKLAKCSMAMDEEDVLGDVSSDIKLTDKYLKWCKTDLPSEECHKCIFLPLCQGGCKAGHLGRSTVKHYIYRNCFDDILKEILKSTQQEDKQNL